MVEIIFDGSGLILPMIALSLGIALYLIADRANAIIETILSHRQYSFMNKLVENKIKDKEPILGGKVSRAKNEAQKPIKKKDKFDKIPKVIKDDLVDEKDKKRFGLF